VAHILPVKTKLDLSDSELGLLLFASPLVVNMNPLTESLPGFRRGQNLFFGRQ